MRKRISREFRKKATVVALHALCYDTPIGVFAVFAAAAAAVTRDRFGAEDVNASAAYFAFVVVSVEKEAHFAVLVGDVLGAVAVVAVVVVVIAASFAAFRRRVLAAISRCRYTKTFSPPPPPPPPFADVVCAMIKQKAHPPFHSPLPAF